MGEPWVYMDLRVYHKTSEKWVWCVCKPCMGMSLTDADFCRFSHDKQDVRNKERDKNKGRSDEGRNNEGRNDDMREKTDEGFRRKD